MINVKGYTTEELKTAKRMAKMRLDTAMADNNTDRIAEETDNIKALNKELRQRSERRWRNTPPHLKGGK